MRRGLVIGQARYTSAARPYRAEFCSCRLRGVPSLNSERMISPRLRATATSRCRFWIFAIPRNQVRLAPPVLQT
jgi:hypothetical protein